MVFIFSLFKIETFFLILAVNGDQIAKHSFIKDAYFLHDFTNTKIPCTYE